MFYSLISITLFVFLVFLITDFLVILLEPAFSGRMLIFLCSAAFIGIILTIGVSAFNPILSEITTTLRKMLRIGNLSNPLLLKLSSNAPGTYHHSLNVSTLAQKAAKAIGADSLLVRTASYYHDIGKLDNPTAYVENQSGLEIPTAEDEDSIKKNAKIIISHVENGIRIAKSHDLPEKIIDMIAEHHGTTRALYFYGKAKEKGLKIKRTDFKYPGPIPQSKESAILMFSDCAEATTRSMSNLTSEQINDIVKKSIEERKGENQLKNSGLSEKELGIIGKSLAENLRSIYHQRIDYKNNDKH